MIDYRLPHKISLLIRIKSCGKEYSKNIFDIFIEDLEVLPKPKMRDDISPAQI